MESNSQKPTLIFRLYEPQDYAGLKNVMQMSYADLKESYAFEDNVNLLSALYPRGQIVCTLDEEIIGASLNRIAPYAEYIQPHSQEKCIDASLYAQDTIAGDSLYAVDTFLHPQYQGLKIGKQLVQMLLDNLQTDNLFALFGNSRLVNYSKYAHEMSIATYAEKVKNRVLYDPVLSFHYSNGMEFVCENPNFSPEDTKSAGHGAIVAVKNPKFNPSEPIYADRLIKSY
jgi:GNAT superfamily N-acetyltransferase